MQMQQLHCPNHELPSTVFTSQFAQKVSHKLGHNIRVLGELVWTNPVGFYKRNY